MNEPSLNGYSSKDLISDQVGSISTTGSGSSSAAFRPFTFDEILTEPPKKWLVEGLIGRGDMVLIYGHGKIGKSLVVFDLMAALATGHCQFANAFSIEDPISVFYATGEGQTGIANRIRALNKKWNLHQSARDRIQILKTIPQLMNLESSSGILTFARWYLEECGDRLTGGVLILDTLSRASIGGDENTVKDTTLMLVALQQAAELLQCTIIVVHHANKTNSGGRGNDIRGSSNLLAGFDSVVQVRESEGKRFMRCEFAKDAGRSVDLEFQIGVHEWGDVYNQQHSCVFVDWIGVRAPTKKEIHPATEEIHRVLREYAKYEDYALTTASIRKLMADPPSLDQVRRILRSLTSKPGSNIRAKKLQIPDANNRPNRYANHYWIEESND